jgi:RNA polymerase sigma factor (sigma-70 family)
VGTFLQNNQQMFEKSAKITDEVIISALLGGVDQRELVFKYFYQNSGYRSWVIDYVCSNQGDLASAEDVFQEAVIILDRSIRENKYEGSSSIKTYFFGIAKQYWFNQRRRMNKTIHLEIPDGPDQSLSIEDNLLQEDIRNLIDDILLKIGEQCKKVLSLYKLSLSNKEISAELGLSSPELAKKYTYRCREKFKAYVLKRADLMKMLSIKNSGHE